MSLNIKHSPMFFAYLKLFTGFIFKRIDPQESTKIIQQTDMGMGIYIPEET
jgi:hypothetical protein